MGPSGAVLTRLWFLQGVEESQSESEVEVIEAVAPQRARGKGLHIRKDCIAFVLLHLRVCLC